MSESSAVERESESESESQTSKAEVRFPMTGFSPAKIWVWREDEREKK